MRMIPDDIRAGVRRLFRLPPGRPEDAHRDADAELASVIDAKTEYLTARGMAPDAARAEARRMLGEPGGTRADLRRSAERRERRLAAFERLGEATADMRYALRTFRRAPLFAGAAVVTLALGIGANTAIYSAVSAVILRPLPYTDPDRLVTVGEDNADFRWRLQDAAPANYLDWKDQVAAFRGVAAYEPFQATTTLSGYGAPRLLTTTAASGGLFDVLGVRAALGRTFQEAETWRGTGDPPPAVLSYRVWRDVFGASDSLIGKTVPLDGRAVQVVGVLPERFSIPGLDIDVWRPLAWDPADRTKVWFRRAHFIRVVARLAPGATLTSANTALQTVVSRLKTEYPATNAHMGASIEPLHHFLAGAARLPLTVAFAAAGGLLLIACGNVANLLLVRAAVRSREAAVRRALGAGRGRLARQALTESLVLAALGGVAGLALGWWGTRVFAALMPHDLLPVRDVGMSWSVLAFVFLVTAVCGVAFGTGPALWTARRHPADVLKEEGRTSSGAGRTRRWGDALLVSQVAIALALTLGAGLLVRSYMLLQHVSPGFEAERVLAVTLDLPGLRFDGATRINAFFEELQRRARELPGVESTALASSLPLSGPPWSSEFAVAGRPPMSSGGDVVHRELSPDYQRVMRVRLLRGRLFTEADRIATPLVVLINETLARTYFGGEDPVGLRVAFDRIPDSASAWRTIVGVVGDERQTGMGVPARPEFIAPAAQDVRRHMTLLVRTTGDPLAVAPAVRRSVAALDPGLAIASMKTMNEVRAASLARDRFLTALFLAFATVGMALGVIGVYGVVTQLARRRTREIGIRVALGARRWQVQWLVVRRGLALSVLGVAIGLGVALEATRVMRTLLFGVAPADPVTFVTVPLLVLLTVVVASWVPAARASRADASEVLRAE
ncbi:MAG TPA: ABC transporter permease [Gemmatimonadaceae bacterium]|nr:ABC transporter permease [Gemmatimonadaceae bacterium]